MPRQQSVLPPTCLFSPLEVLRYDPCILYEIFFTTFLLFTRIVLCPAGISVLLVQCLMFTMHTESQIFSLWLTLCTHRRGGNG